MKSIITAAIEQYKKTINPASKWYTQDIADFKQRISVLPTKEVERILNNLSSMNNGNSNFNKSVKSEVKALNKAGMFEMKNLSPNKCLA